MIRLHIVVEGQTEETFANRVLAHHLGDFNISVDARRVQTGRRRAQIFRGGLREYQQIRKDLILWMKEDQNSDAFFTTMIDLYALPNDFPCYEVAKKAPSPYDRVQLLQEAFSADIDHVRFMPYIQLHEFEAILLCEPARFDWIFINHEDAISELENLSSIFDSPELINDHPETAPSKRITSIIPEYEGRKPLAGPIIAEKIGLEKIRSKCPHFDSWLNALERLG
ncbi:MAG: DUF4276 family protein [Anaerolineaceae bacterium]|nr:DUF4276 family protein [Anaerolineaceae bacterium]